jgi:phosphomannomutase
MDKSIFRSYDIRGIYPAELSEAGAYAIGQAIGEYAKPNKVAVGRDARLSAPSIHRAVCQGLRDFGCEVLDAGMTGTDMMAWASGAFDFDITINVTASHNPKEWIGLKIYARGGKAVGGDGEIQEIGRLALLDTAPYANDEKWEPEKIDLLPKWTDHVLSFVDIDKIRPMKIVVDAGNGVAGPIVRELFSRLPIEMVEMYFEPDGTFPYHLPSPIEPANTFDLQARVKAENADLGIAFDGDADRMFLIDDMGQWVNGSETTALVMDALLTQDSSRVMLYNAICGWNVRDVIARHSAKAYRTKVGHAYIRKDMAKYGAYFGGEHSGHYFFASNFNGDSGLIAAVVALGLLSQSGQRLAQALEPYRQYQQIPETNFKVDDPKVAMEKIAAQYSDGEVDWLDGLTVRYNDWWFNVRPSSNEPLLRLNVEAINQELLEEKAGQLTESITQSGRASV